MSEKYVFNRNVSHGSLKEGKKHTHFLKGHAVPDHLLKEMKDLGLASAESDKSGPKDGPRVSVKQEPPQEQPKA